MRVLYVRHSSGRWLFGSHVCCAVRTEKIRSFARDFSSSRRAPPNAASNPWSSRACLSATVFMTSVWISEPCSNGLIPGARPSELTCTISSIPLSSAMRSRNAYISRAPREEHDQQSVQDHDDPDDQNERSQEVDLRRRDQVVVVGALGLEQRDHVRAEVRSDLGNGAHRRPAKARQLRCPGHAGSSQCVPSACHQWGG